MITVKTIVVRIVLFFRQPLLIIKVFCYKIHYKIVKVFVASWMKKKQHIFIANNVVIGSFRVLFS